MVYYLHYRLSLKVEQPMSENLSSSKEDVQIMVAPPSPATEPRNVLTSCAGLTKNGPLHRKTKSLSAK